MACFWAGVNNGIYSAVSSMTTSARRTDVIADNLANLSTIGFKRRETSIGDFEVRMPNGPTRTLAAATSWDFEQGILQRTGEPYHMALFGRGFFAVDGPKGELYTRNGNFHIGEDGVLKTDDDLPVAWRGRGAVIDPAGAPVVVGPDGTVIQGTTVLGQVRVVDFEDPQKLRAERSGYFQAPARLAERPAEAEVHQGALESSNASGVREMLELIEVQRAFEMSANVLTQYDQSYRRLTRPT